MARSTSIHLACVLALVILPFECRRIDLASGQNVKSLRLEDDAQGDLNIEEVQEDSDEEEDTNKASYLKSALGLLRSQVDKLAEASKDKAADVMVKVADFAADAKDKALSAGVEILQEANMCDPEKRKAAAAMLAKMQSHVVQVTDLAAEKWPAIQDNSVAFAKETTKKIVLLGQQVKDWGMTQSERTEVQQLVQDIKNKYGGIVMAVRSKQPDWANKAEDTIAAFIAKASELSSKLAGMAKDAYQADSTQSALRVIQARVGQLMQAAADKWPQVKQALGRVASAIFEKAKELGGKLGAAMCSPENHERVRALVASVQSSIKTLVQAIVERWPVVRQSFHQFADQVAVHASNLRTIFKGYMAGDADSDEVQSALSSIQTQIVVMKSSASATANGLRERLPRLLLVAARFEGTSDLDAKEVEADPANSCFFKDIKYHPVNMVGTTRTKVESAEACQQLCADTPGCVHFSYWRNGGCHRQDESSTAMRMAWRVVSGPASCN